MKGWSIRRRLLLAFVGVLIPYLALASVGALGFGLLWGTIGGIRKHAMGDVVVAADLQIAVAELLFQVDDYLIAADPAEREELERRLAKVREVLARVEAARLAHPEERRVLAEVQGRISEIEALGREILGLRDPRGDRAAAAKERALDALGKETIAALHRFRDANVQEVVETVERGATLLWRIAGLGLAALLVSAAGGVGLALIFSRWIGGPLLAIAEGSRRMGEGDLSARVEERGGAELGATARAFNTMAERLGASFVALAERTRQIEILHVAARVLTTEVDQVRLLQGIVETARELIEARYGALATFGKDGQIAQFFTAGLTPEERERIGPLPKGRGLLGHVFKDGQTLRLDDLSTHRAAVGFPPGHPPMGSLLAAPIRFRGEILGALFLTEKPGGFTADDEALLTTLCADAAVTMQNARLYGEAEARLRAAEALEAVGRDLVQSLDLAVVGQRIIESIHRLLRVRFAALYRLEPESGDLVALAVSENMDPIIGPGLVFPKGAGAIGLAVKEGRPVVSEDVLADPRLAFPPEVRARVEQASFRSIIALPLLTKKGVIGVLGIGDEPGRVFDADEIRLAQAFADQAALAMENARLHQDLVARVRELEDALGRVKQLQGLLPICAWCKKIRRDQNYWQSVEGYVAEHADVRFSHGICPECREKLAARREANG
jgi:GAF domain-containing protein/HAMP domain-containing protein